MLPGFNPKYQRKKKVLWRGYGWEAMKMLLGKRTGRKDPPQPGTSKEIA